MKSLRAVADAVRANRYDEAAAALQSTRVDGTPLEPYVEYYRALVDSALTSSCSGAYASVCTASLTECRSAAAAHAVCRSGSRLEPGRCGWRRGAARGAVSGADRTTATSSSTSGRPRPARPAARRTPRACGCVCTTNSRRASWQRLRYGRRRRRMQGAAVGTPGAFPHDLTRAEALLAAGRAADAEAALKHLEALLPASADAADAQARRDRIQLRLAQAACAQRRCGAALERPDRPRRARASAPGRRSTCSRRPCGNRGRRTEYRRGDGGLSGIAPGSPADPWIERALNEYGTYLVKMDADADAAAMFRQSVRSQFVRSLRRTRGVEVRLVRAIVRAASTRPFACSSWLRRRFRAPTPVPPGCTGPAGRANTQGDQAGATQVLTLTARRLLPLVLRPDRVGGVDASRARPFPPIAPALAPGIVLDRGGWRRPRRVARRRAASRQEQTDATMVASEPAADAPT